MSLAKSLALVAISLLPSIALAQQLGTGNAAVGGVAITTDGLLQYRQTTAAPAPSPSNRKPDLLYLSLPRVLAQWQAAKDAGTDPSPDIRFLKGLTQIQNIFIYPAEHDIVLAGPAEPFKPANSLEPRGTLSGRPLVQLEDLITALRAVMSGGGSAADAPVGGGGADALVGRGGGRRPPNNTHNDFFGCSLENPANFQDAWSATLAKFASAPRATLQAEMQKALGPQEVRLYGIPPDSRIALTMLAADYHLKRISMGVEPLAAIGNALGNQVAAPRLWFEPAYLPLLVSPDNSAYELRGPRLKVQVGAQLFNAGTGGVGDAQKKFAENFTTKMSEVAPKVDAIADLQNVTDCFMTAALIRQDRLLQSAGIDLAWLLSSDGQSKYKTASLPVPKTAETVVHINGTVIAEGGVAFTYANFINTDRTKIAASDPKTTLSASPSRPLQTWFLSTPKLPAEAGGSSGS